MKLLFWQWNAFMQKGMEYALKKMNIEYDVIMQIPTDWEKDEKLYLAISGKLNGGIYDKVISVNYCPVVSDACEKFNVEYISWVYDSPIHIRDISTFNNPCNRIYFFDRGQKEYYEKQGYKNVFHLPLAADEKVWQDAFKNIEEKKKKYSCDVAFLGKLYDSDYNYLMGPLPLYERGKMEGYLSVQSKLYGAYMLDELITDELLNSLNVHYAKASNNTVKIKREELEYAMACEVTGRERKMILELLNSRCNLHVHTGKDSSKITGITNCGYADYYSEMPAIFRFAKINLNISLRTIRTGIPLRIIDILSCGGFVISNFQEELLEYFEPGVDIVIYEDVLDLINQVAYYLAHNEEREMIAKNGQEKVRKYFSFEDKMRELLG